MRCGHRADGQLTTRQLNQSRIPNCFFAIHNRRAQADGGLGKWAERRQEMGGDRKDSNGPRLGLRLSAPSGFPSAPAKPSRATDRVNHCWIRLADGPVAPCFTRAIREERLGRFGRRGGRGVGALRAKLVERGKGRGGSRRKQNKRGHSGHGLNLHQGKHRSLLLFGLLSFADEFADAAGVLTVEGFRERLAQGGLLRKRDEHAGPRDGLEQRPVQPHGQGHGQNHGKFGGTLEQDGGFDGRAGSGIQAPRNSSSTGRTIVMCLEASETTRGGTQLTNARPASTKRAQ